MQPSTVAEYQRRADEAEDSPAPIFLKAGRIIVWCLYALALIAVVILLLAFLLRLFGASTDASFTRWMYRSADSIMRPFRGIFPTRQLSDDSVFDPSLLFGAICYTVVALGADGFHHWLSRRLAAQEAQIAKARAEADAVRRQYEAQQYHTQQAAAAAQHAAQQPQPIPTTVRIEVPAPAPASQPTHPPQPGAPT
ncbi:MAG: hypothetical protein QM733_00770 [Ilumatobacteraceae bacterium]